MKQKFYKIDEWNAKETGSDYYFVDTLEKAMSYVTGKIEGSRPGYEYTVINPFMAETCDIEGYINSDLNEFAGMTFINPDDPQEWER